MSVIETESTLCAHNYHPLPVVLVRGEGAWLWDDRGTRYLDMMSAYSAVSHGHSHPRDDLDREIETAEPADPQQTRARRHDETGQQRQ